MENLTENQIKLIAELKEEFGTINTLRNQESENSLATNVLERYNETEVILKEESLKQSLAVSNLIDQFISDMKGLKHELSKLQIPVRIEPLRWDDDTKKMKAGDIIIGVMF